MNAERVTTVVDDPRDDPAVRAAWDKWNHHIPECFWDVAVWVDGAATFGSLDVANRYEIWAHAYLRGVSADTDPAQEKP